MADYQYQPKSDDSVSKLRNAMGHLDGMAPSNLRYPANSLEPAVDSILSFRIPEEKEDYTILENSTQMDIDIDPQLLDPTSNPAAMASRIKSNLRLPPPPLFSRQAVPQLYKLRYLLSSACIPFQQLAVSKPTPHLSSRL